MKALLCLLAPTFFLSVSCDKDKDMDGIKHLNCETYWSQVAFSNFCGLSRDDFDYNMVVQDICNADQKDAFAFDDLISIRVYNHFTTENANEEYSAEKDDASGLPGYQQLPNLGDDAFGILVSEFGELDQAEILVVVDTYTISLIINGNASIGANNCFDEALAVEFARALAAPL